MPATCGRAGTIPEEARIWRAQISADGRQKLAIQDDLLTTAIATRLALTPASAGEVAEELGVPVEAIRHRLRVLVRASLIDRLGTTRRRGVSEYLYSCDPRRTVISGEEVAELPAQRLDEAALRWAGLLFREAIGAVDAGTFSSRNEHALIRFAIPLDETTWKEVDAIHGALTESILEVTEQAAARLEDSGDEKIVACAAILLFDAPGTDLTPSAGERTGPPRRHRRRESERHRVDLIGGLMEPFRQTLMDALSLAPASVGELAARTGVPAEKVRYELKVLHEAGLVGVHSERARRGTIERLFLAESREMVIRAKEIGSYSEGHLDSYYRRELRLLFGDALKAVRAGKFHERGVDSYRVRIPMVVDPAAFNEISALMEEALDRLLDLREECLASEGEQRREPRPGISNMLLFERAPTSIADILDSEPKRPRIS